MDKAKIQLGGLMSSMKGVRDTLVTGFSNAVDEGLWDAAKENISRMAEDKTADQDRPPETDDGI